MFNSYQQSLRKSGTSYIDEVVQRYFQWYEHFEQIITFILSLLVTAFIVTALIQLFNNIFPLMVGGVYWLLRGRDDRLEALTNSNLPVTESNR